MNRRRWRSGGGKQLSRACLPRDAMGAHELGRGGAFVLPRCSPMTNPADWMWPVSSRLDCDGRAFAPVHYDRP